MLAVRSPLIEMKVDPCGTLAKAAQSHRDAKAMARAKPRTDTFKDKRKLILLHHHEKNLASTICSTLSRILSDTSVRIERRRK